ncbi:MULTISPECIES: hypothetical protein [Microvirga]|uniref:hypothetical protein n=1 Tax=Microvirga TaxID=186650 RepID=UPI001CFFDC69|nr:hypothetical protein [Microvirga lenta]MCB5176066.1 hypothetical protein [Microvirga lenta]
MRHLAPIPALVLVGGLLGGCNTGAPQGVLPRDPLPPPPSLNASASRQTATATAREAGPGVRRRAISVPDRIETPRPSSPSVEPVMTPSGAGAGFRF